jgi:hypothetical protein
MLLEASKGLFHFFISAGSSVFPEKAVKWKVGCTGIFHSESGPMARREGIALPSELAARSGSRLEPMSLLVSCQAFCSLAEMSYSFLRL